MKLYVDKWHFVPSPEDGSIMTLELILENAQHAWLKINALTNPYSRTPQIPEMFVLCEMPGEKSTQEPLPKRWIYRAPDPTCEWSGVELPPKLMQEIQDRLNAVPQS
jgi:hypothetical protein